MEIQDVVRQGFSRRLFRAHSALEAREGRRVGRAEIAKRVGLVLGSEPPDENTVNAWFTRGVVPPPQVGIGVAIVYDVSPGWLYFAQFNELGAPSLPMPELPDVASIAKVTEPVPATPYKVAETREEKAAKKTPAKRRTRGAG